MPHTTMAAVCAPPEPAELSGYASSHAASAWQPEEASSSSREHIISIPLSLSNSRVVIHHHVPHFQQAFNWDCGLACALMALHGCGIYAGYEQLRQLCCTTSVWTVDIAHLLRRFGLEVWFFTITLGPNPAYINETFYMENMEEDERRVSQLFMDASKQGILLQQRSVGTQELQEFLLSGTALVIALVDKRKLDPWLMAADMCLPALCGIDVGYAGHYILIVGLDPEAQQYIVRDPASSRADLRLSVSAVEQARKSFGTDEDLLVIQLPKVQ